MAREFEQLTIEQVARYPRPGTVVPAGFQFTPDSKHLLYLFSGEGTLARSLWRLDVATGETTELVAASRAGTDESALSEEEQLRRERARLREVGVTTFHIAARSPELTIVLPMGGSVFVCGHDGGLREVAAAAGAIDPRPSPDGSRIAFVRDGELHVADVAGGEARKLTTGAEQGLTHGLAGFIAQEELARSRGFWWSADGTRLAFERNDERHVPIYPIVHQGQDRPLVEEHRYPFAGGANARVGLGVVSASGGEVTWMDLGEDQDIYLARVAWMPNGSLAAQLLSRDQRSARWCAFDVETGDSRIIVEDKQEPWLNLDHDTRFLKSGEILRSSEETGYRHLELLDADGQRLGQLTSGDWMVTGVTGVVEKERTVFFQATRESELERHIYAVSLDGGAIERLTTAPGWHSAQIARDGSLFVDHHSSQQHAPRVTLRHRDGSEAAEIFDNRGYSAPELGLAPPRMLAVPAEDGTPLHAAVYEPAGDGPHPVVVAVYGGPHAQQVADQWGMTVDLRAHYLAQHGIAVVKIDNRGSANRGLAFEAHLAGRFGEVEVVDQVAGLRKVAGELGNLDLGRAGVYGWSYGGYMTLMLMLKEPNLFRVGVAGAPVADWDGYDTGYTERYLGTPATNPEGSRDSSVLPLAGQLEGDLLLVHGMVDENVHFRHTARLMKRLAEEQKRFDTLIFPEERHMPREARGLEYQERVVLDYLVSRLELG